MGFIISLWAILPFVFSTMETWEESTLNDRLIDSYWPRVCLSRILPDDIAKESCQTQSKEDQSAEASLNSKEPDEFGYIIDLASPDDLSTCTLDDSDPENYEYETMMNLCLSESPGNSGEEKDEESTANSIADESLLQEICHQNVEKEINQEEISAEKISEEEKTEDLNFSESSSNKFNSEVEAEDKITSPIIEEIALDLTNPKTCEESMIAGLSSPEHLSQTEGSVNDQISELVDLVCPEGLQPEKIARKSKKTRQGTDKIETCDENGRCPYGRWPVRKRVSRPPFGQSIYTKIDMPSSSEESEETPRKNKRRRKIEKDPEVRFYLHMKKPMKSKTPEDLLPDPSIKKLNNNLIKNDSTEPNVQEKAIEEAVSPVKPTNSEIFSTTHPEGESKLKPLESLEESRPVTFVDNTPERQNIVEPEADSNPSIRQTSSALTLDGERSPTELITDKIPLEIEKNGESSSKNTKAPTSQPKKKLKPRKKRKKKRFFPFSLCDLNKIWLSKKNLPYSDQIFADMDELIEENTQNEKSQTDSEEDPEKLDKKLFNLYAKQFYNYESPQDSAG